MKRKTNHNSQPRYPYPCPYEERKEESKSVPIKGTEYLELFKRALVDPKRKKKKREGFFGSKVKSSARKAPTLFF